jgi:predicted nuclease of predicted toxin-antitoxin system
MRLYIDDDSVDPSLIRLLRRDGHDVQVPADVGLAGSSDHAHLAHAIRQQRAIVTRNYGDFDDLHDLVILAANGHHAGILVVLYDNNPRNAMSPGDIARAVRNLEKAGVAIADSYHELNHWQ